MSDQRDNTHAVPRIVITGAPGSGKSVFMERLKSEPLLSAFTFFPEAAREILIEQPDIRGRWGEFHQLIHARQTARESAVSGKPFVTDRGTVDAHAFHPETLANVGTTLEAEYRRYTLVIQLGSAASLPERPWVPDEIRRESREDALEIERATTDAWRQHAGYVFVPAQTDMEAKYFRVKELITAHVNAVVDESGSETSKQ